MYPELLNDAGHGKNTYPPSKGVPGLPEFEFNSAVAAETKKLLNGKVETFEAQPLNGNDVPLTTRTNIYNARYAKNNKAIGISSHANANGKQSVRGFGVFYWYASTEAKKLAQIILDEYKKEFPDREKYPIWGTGLFASKPGTWTDLHICRETDGVFVLVEWEFMTNREALKLLKSEEYRKCCAMVKAKATCRWYGIEWVQNEGWKKESGKWSFYNAGQKETGWIRDKNKWYYLDAAGVMQTGWVKDKGKWYYLNPDPDKGEMFADRTIEDKGKLYYLGKDGAMVSDVAITVKLKADKDGSLRP